LLIIARSLGNRSTAASASTRPLPAAAAPTQRDPSLSPRRARSAGTAAGCRFISSRQALDIDRAALALEQPLEREGAASSAAAKEYQLVLARRLFDGGSPAGPILQLHAAGPSSPQFQGVEPSLREAYQANSKRSRLAPGSRRRHIAATPTRILDAPGLHDNFYLNLLHWGASNLLAVGLDETAYLYSPETGAVTEVLTAPPRRYVSAIGFDDTGATLAVGTSGGQLTLVDVVAGALTRAPISSAHGRVSSLAWSSGAELTLGHEDGAVTHHDLRVRGSGVVVNLPSHRGEVCGLKWSADATGQLACGANDHLLRVYDARALGTPKLQLEAHTAAVKAVAWCPWRRNNLASGGGSADRYSVYS